MRHLRHHRQWTPTRAGAQHHHMRTAPPGLQRRCHGAPGTVPVRRLPGRARPHRRPFRTGPRHRGRRLRVGGRRHRPRRRHRANPATRGRGRTGLRRLHRLRCLRGRLPERVWLLVHRRQARPPVATAARAAGTRTSGPVDGRAGRRRIRALHPLRRMRASLSGRDPDHCGRRAQPRAAPCLGEAVPGAGQREDGQSAKTPATEANEAWPSSLGPCNLLPTNTTNERP